MHSDGTPLRRDRRQITVDRTEEGTEGTRTFQDKFMVGDNGIAHYRFTPHEQATFIRVRVSEQNENRLLS